MRECLHLFDDPSYNSGVGVTNIGYADARAKIDDAVAIDVLQNRIVGTLNDYWNRDS
jgi:hypothetical protein